MARTRPTLLLRALLLAVGLLVLWGSAPAAAQDQDGATTTAPADDDGVSAADAAKCQFTKREAIDANGGPLGPSVWGRLCQVIDGKAQYPAGVVITVSLDGEAVGTDTTGDDGVFVVEIPGNGTYQVALDPETLPKGFSLTDDDRAVLEAVPVKLGDQQAIFRLGADTRGQRDLGDYATTVAKGLRLGLILAVAAVGLSLVYGVTGLVNFAHAELVTFGAIATYVIQTTGAPIWLAILGGAAVGLVGGVVQEKGLWAPLRRRRMALLSMMVVSIGLSIMLRNLFQIAFGPSGKRYEAASGQREREWLAGIRLTPNDVTIMVLCVLILVAVGVLLRRTRTGTAIRAVADNPDLAASSGIAVDRIIAVVWAACGALAAAGGSFYALTVNVKFDTGFILLLSMFAAVVLGGLGSAPGAVLGAIIIGVVQETSGLFVDTAFKFVAALAVLIVVLLVRPQGLLGKRERFG